MTDTVKFHARVMADPPALETISARELQGMDFPAIRYIARPYIVEGLTLLAGKPKIGKSWLSLDLALGVALGGVALGSVECEAGSVLFAALEDNRRRLKRRIKQMLVNDCEWPERLDLATELRRLDAGGLDDVARWADEAYQPRLIVLDTLAKVRPARRSHEASYDADYTALAPLQEFAGARGIGVLVVHHVRKMDSDDPLDTVSGTTGLTGAADTVLVLARDAQGTVLHGRGRDADEIEHAMAFDRTTGRWTVQGDAAEARRSDERNRIIDALREHGAPMGPKAIAKAVGISEDSAKQTVRRMVQAGDLNKTGRGQYEAL